MEVRLSLRVADVAGVPHKREFSSVFVLVVQSFVKVSALNALAPTQTEPHFAATQTAVAAIFILITLIAVIKFRPAKAQM
jgi:hypothetical protein